VKTTADICLLLSSYVDWRKISHEFTRQVIAQGQGHCSESSRGIRLPISGRG